MKARRARDPAGASRADGPAAGPGAAATSAAGGGGGAGIGRRGEGDYAAASVIDRRSFLKHAAGLTLAICFARVPAQAQTSVAAADPGPPVFTPSAFVRIGTDSSVTVIAEHLEMGQGVFTGLATLLAEELDADWNDVHVEGAPADVKRYADPATGLQGTVGSTSMASAYLPMRRAGAQARALLVAAAAARWQVPPASIVVSNGVVSHPPSDRRTRFGALTAAAAMLPLPAQVTLKDPSQFKLIGNPWVRRKDAHAKTNGSALFTQDLRLPGMLIAVVARPRRFGATVKSFDAGAARAIDGVVDVVPFAGGPQASGGIAVLARNTWIAQRGRAALQIEWDESHAVRPDSSKILERYRQLAQSPGALARSAGDVDAVPLAETTLVQAQYELPYLAHAAMEPMNCLVHLAGTAVSLWNGEQLQTPDQAAIGALLALAPEQVQITQLYAGGSFGRRANPHADYLLEAVSIARAAAAQGHQAPIKLVWTRSDDMRAGYYRPAFVHRIQALLDAQGTLISWQQRIVGQSVMTGSPFAATQIKDGIDASSVEGAAEPYEIPNVRIELATPDDVGVPVQWWQSAGHSHTAFATECMLDELAAAAGVDPYQFRRGLLAMHPRALAVLDLAAAKAGWDSALPAAAAAGGAGAGAGAGANAGPAANTATAANTGATAGTRRGRGIALHESFGTCVAQVAEVSVAADGTLRVDRVVCAVDCGVPINPNVITAQMQSGIGYGLCAALRGAITLQDGLVEQSDFDHYAALRLSAMPAVEVHIVPSHEPPTGVGQQGTPPIAPAVVNAIFNATGKRIRTLPIADQLRGAAAAAPAPSAPAAGQ